ncbi:flagellar protein FlhE [Edwardsiella anguillarum]|uniref:flagellar protein FlhE n=1 Tax=Edwardsiella anguillarum TaxID=1821960 RepID=UPI0024B7C31F|nr:flagellar protein FlhE [Edwardsiella anguillarum]WHP81437.1 flagellar protein FlhE [Edwardsiella anguillarum]WHQ18939.1 flagellar protein FlhE [Edwardsiella anguillarum]WHQ22483.1 flagellar protein FlhE [Edwardsiella anguillarum]WHQ26005.1 flagellar protein FlhE [Edwardsiella anguillarum]WHQ29526.1 flagellar protein FlhE [Edwardsiella anguillarum]
MKRLLCLAILLAPWAAQAGGGSWSADGNGRILSQKGMASNQPPLAPPAGSVPAAAAIDDVVWQITLLSPAPDGLNLQLCSARRCMALDGLSGRSAGLNGESAAVPLRLVMWVAGKGTIYPPINVVSQQVIVNYH